MSYTRAIGASSRSTPGKSSAPVSATVPSTRCGAESSWSCRGTESRPSAARGVRACAARWNWRSMTTRLRSLRPGERGCRSETSRRRRSFPSLAATSLRRCGTTTRTCGQSTAQMARRGCASSLARSSGRSRSVTSRTSGSTPSAFHPTARTMPRLPVWVTPRGSWWEPSSAMARTSSSPSVSRLR